VAQAANPVTYRIVVGVDGSEHSNAALRWALAEAEAHSGMVTAILAWQMPFLSFPGAFNRDELDQGYKNFLIETVSAVAPTPAVPLETLVAEGDPTEALVEASKGANLLVMGTRGRSPFAGLLLGAVSQGAAANAHCPVVLVKRSDEPSPP
jgi:nucleotide-binding universal stress UspA family protein